MEVSIDQLKSLAGDRYYYLASPYSSSDPLQQKFRNAAVHSHMGWMMSQGLIVYSPIWACHHASLDYKLPGDAEYWKSFNEAFLYPAAGTIVVMLKGWVESKGVQYEIQRSIDLMKRVYTFEPFSREFSLYAE